MAPPEGAREDGEHPAAAWMEKLLTNHAPSRPLHEHRWFCEIVRVLRGLAGPPRPQSEEVQKSTDPRQWVHALQQGSLAIVAGSSRVTSSFANHLPRLLVIAHGVEKRKSPPKPGGDSPCVRGQSQLRHCFARRRTKYESSPAGNDDHQDGRSTN